MVRWLASLLLLGAVAATLGWGLVPCERLHSQPACYVALEPGPIEEASDLMEVAGAQTYGSAGRILLTTVLVDRTVDPAEWLLALARPPVDLVDKALLYPPGTTVAQIRRRNVAAMDHSKLAATVAALRWLGHDVSDEPRGAEVLEVVDDAPAEGRLKPGDVITSVNGSETPRAGAVADLVGELPAGRAVEIRLDDGRTVEVTVAPHPDDPDTGSIGVIIRDYVPLPVEVAIDAGRVGGPSAGLVFSVALVDLLTAEDLTGGRVIAGTGSINADGAVGHVGGVRQKIVAAARGDGELPRADVFLVPRDGLQEARTAPVRHPVTLVPVATLDDALQALRALRASEQPAGAVTIGR